MSRWSREPLLHFAVLGAAIFGIHAWTRPAPRGDARPVIEVQEGEVRRLAEIWRRQWQRPPSEEELRAVVEQHVREEVLYRRALALGLEKDDSMIRQRLAQKMQFLSEDLAELAQPDEAALRRFFDENSARYVEPPALTFSHVYFSRERRGARIAADASEALASLTREPEAASERGDPFLLPFEFTRTSAAEITNQFGTEFATALRAVAPGTWQGPIESTYGLHLVRVTERTEERLPALAEIRALLQRDYQRTKREEANRALLAEMRAGYRITIDEAAIRAAAREEVAQAPR